MLISIIVPVYKVEPYLRKCVDSVLRQTLRDFELILVDDGSPDHCGVMCEEYARKDARVKVIHRENGGLAAARNSGLDYVQFNSKSEYVTFVDSDDWVEDTYLETLVDGVATGAEVSCVTFATVDSHNIRHVRYPDDGWKILSPEDYWVGNDTGNQISAWGKLYRMALFDDVRYPEGRLMEDAFATPRLLFKANKIATREVPLYNYFVNNDSIMRSAWSLRKIDEVEAFEEECAFFKAGGYARAYEKARSAKLTAMAKSIEPLSKIDKVKADEYLAEIQSVMAKGALPFWENRALYRQLRVRGYAVRWLLGMMGDALTSGRKSWLLREACPIARLVMGRAVCRMRGWFK